MATALKPISNGPKAALAAAIPRRCSQCKSILPDLCTNRWCEGCRSKERVKNRRRKERALQLAIQAHFDARGQTAKRVAKKVDDTDADVDVTMTDAPRPDPNPNKRKVVDMDEDCQRAREDGLAPMEYQTQQDLLDALRARVKTSRSSSPALSSRTHLNFRGSFTIITDPEVHEERRVRRVVGELTKSAGMRVGDLVLRENERSCDGHARTYWCACAAGISMNFKSAPVAPALATASRSSSSRSAWGHSMEGAEIRSTFSPTHAPKPHSASQQPSRLNSDNATGKGTLVGWLGKPRPKPADIAETDDGPSPGCGGTVLVYAAMDSSHPLSRMGVKGQRITVEIEHPGRNLAQAMRW